MYKHITKKPYPKCISCIKEAESILKLPAPNQSVDLGTSLHIIKSPAKIPEEEIGPCKLLTSSNWNVYFSNTSLIYKRGLKHVHSWLGLCTYVSKDSKNLVKCEKKHIHIKFIKSINDVFGWQKGKVARIPKTCSQAMRELLVSVPTKFT